MQYSAQPFDYQGFCQLCSHFISSITVVLTSQLVRLSAPPIPLPLLLPHPLKNTTTGAKTINSTSWCYLHWLWRILCGGGGPTSPDVCCGRYRLRETASSCGCRSVKVFLFKAGWESCQMCRSADAAVSMSFLL